MNMIQRNCLQPSYRKKCIKLAALFKDRPQDPKITAVWWIEYVLRHNGAHFLKPESTRLQWYQRRLLDAWGLLLLTTIGGTALLVKLIKYIMRPKRKPVPASAQTKKQPGYLKTKDKLS